MSTKPLNLPEVAQDELAMARAYVNSVLGDASLPEGDGFVHLVARYGFLRQNQEAFLRNLVASTNAQELPPDMKVLKTFHGATCEACGKEKKQNYWVCNGCWKLLPREFTGQLWRGFRTKDIGVYFQALAWLKTNKGTQTA